MVSTHARKSGGCAETDVWADLIAYCKEENVPYTVFNDFSGMGSIHPSVHRIVDTELTAADIMRDVKSVVEGGKTAADVAMNR